MPLVAPKVPDNLIEIMKDLAKSVIKENPENIYEYSAIYFENLLKQRDGDMNKNYRRFNNLIRKDSKNRMFLNIEPIKKVGNKPSPPPQQPPPIRYDDILGQFDETSYIKAALKIQNAFREFILKKKLQSSDIGSNANEKEILAAKVIQSAFKRYLDVRQHKKLSIISEEDSKTTDISEKGVNIEEANEKEVIVSEEDNKSAFDVSEEPKLLIEDIGPDENDEKLEVIFAKRIEVSQNEEPDNKKFEYNSKALPEKINDIIQTENESTIDMISEQLEEKSRELLVNSDKVNDSFKSEDENNINKCFDSENNDEITNIENQIDKKNISLNLGEILDNSQQSKDEESLNKNEVLDKNETVETNVNINDSKEEIDVQAGTESELKRYDSRTPPNELAEFEQNIVESEITKGSSDQLNEVLKIKDEPEDSITLVHKEIKDATTKDDYKTEIVEAEQNEIIDSTEIMKVSIQQHELISLSNEEEHESPEEKENAITLVETESIDQFKNANESASDKLESVEKKINDDALDKIINIKQEDSKDIVTHENEELQMNATVVNSDLNNEIVLMEEKKDLENTETGEVNAELNSTDEEKLDKIQEVKITTQETNKDVNNELNREHQSNLEEDMKSEINETLENGKYEQKDVKRAATNIQKTYRGYRVRRNKENDEKNKIIEEQEQNQLKVLNSVLIIQKMYRGFRTRKLLSNKEKNLDDSEEPDRNLSTAETIEISDDHINFDESMQSFNLKSPFGCEDYEVYQDQSTVKETNDAKRDKVESMSQFGISSLGCEGYELYQQDLDKLTIKNEKNNNELKTEYVDEEKIKIQGDTISPVEANNIFIIGHDRISDDDGTETQAAIKLQKNYRGYRVRRDIKAQSNQSNGVDDLNKLALSDSNANITCDEDKVEDKVEGETVMNMIWQPDDKVNATSQGNNLDINNTGDEEIIEIEIQESPNVDLEIADVIMNADSQGNHVIISSENIENISEISFTEPEADDIISKSLEIDVEINDNTEISPPVITDAVNTDENVAITLDANKEEGNKLIATDEALSTEQSENNTMHNEQSKSKIENLDEGEDLPNPDLEKGNNSKTDDANDKILEDSQEVVDTLVSQKSLEDKNMKDTDHVEIDTNKMIDIDNQIIKKNDEKLKLSDDKEANLKEESLVSTEFIKNKEISNRKLNSDSEDANAETTDIDSKDNGHSTDLTGDEMDTSENQAKTDISFKEQDHGTNYSNQVEVVEEPFIQQIIERPVFEIKNSLQTDDESLNDLSGRDDLSEIENVDLSSYSKDSLEAMYYSLRKNELLLDRMHQRADDERNSSIDPFNLETESELDLPKEDDADIDDSDEVSGTKQSRQSIADSDSDDIVLRKLSLESSRLLKDELLSEIPKTPMIEEVEEFNDSLNVIENLLDDNQESGNVKENILDSPETHIASSIMVSKEPTIEKVDALTNEELQLSKPGEKPLLEQKEKSYDITEEKDLVSELSDMDEIRRMGSANNERRKSFALFKSNTIQIGAMPLMDSYDQDDDMHISSLERKILTTSLSETDSDYIDVNDRKFGAVINDSDKNIKTALETIPSTDTDSTIVSAATRIQATARGFLTRRRLQKSSLTTTSISEVCHRSFGNSAINESLENFIEQQNNNLVNSDEQEELAAIKIQKKYRQYRDKKFNKQNITLDTDYPSLDDKNDFLGVTEIKLEQRQETNSDNETEREASLPEELTNNINNQHQLSNLLSVNIDDVHARRLTLQRGDAVQRNSTPDDSAASNNSPIAVAPTTQDKDKTIDNSSIELDKETGENFSLITKSKQTTSADTLSSGSSYAESTKSDSNVLMTKQNQQHKNELKTIRSLGPRQRSMPVQMDAFIIRILPKHLRKRVRSAGNNNNKSNNNNNNNNFQKNNKNLF